MGRLPYVNLPGANRVAFDAEQALSSRQTHTHLAHFALCDLEIERRTRVHDSTVEAYQRGVLTKHSRCDFRRPFHARRPAQLDPFARAHHRFDAGLMLRGDAVERNGGGKFHGGLRFIECQRQFAREGRWNPEGKLARDSYLPLSTLPLTDAASGDLHATTSLRRFSTCPMATAVLRRGSAAGSLRRYALRTAGQRQPGERQAP